MQTMRKGVITNVQAERESHGITFAAAKRKLRGIDLARIERHGTDHPYIAQRVAQVTRVPFAAYLRPRIVVTEGVPRTRLQNAKTAKAQ